MIKYNLKCENNHEFESWFSHSKEFDKLNKKKLLECIYCSSKKIEKSIMAPMISGNKSRNKNIDIPSNKFSVEKKELIKIRNYIEKNFEFVGDKLSKKSIYGTASTKEREELEEEGINLVSVPWISKDN